MIYRLVRPDPAWKSLRIAIPLSFLLCAWTGQLPGPWIVVWVILQVLYFVQISLAGMPYQRMGPFEAVLPIAGRQIFLARLLALFALIWLPALTAALTLLVSASGRSGTAWNLVESASIYSLAILILQSGDLHAYAAPPRLTLPCLVAALVLSALLPVIPLAPWIVLMATILPGIAIFYRTWDALPPSFQMTVDEHDGFSLPLPAFAWRILFPWTNLLSLPAAVLMGYDWRWSLAPFCVTATLGFGSISWLFRLPISRRVLLAMILLPVALAYLAGAAIGYRTGHLSWNHRPVAGDTSWVPWDFYRTAPEGLPIVAPWGETALPPRMHVTALVHGETYIYNPYWAGPQNTRQFLEWQFQRATLAVYGEAIPSSNLTAALNRGLRPLPEQPRMQILSATFGLALLLILALLAELAFWHRLWRIPKMMGALPLGLPFLAMFSVPLFVPTQSGNFTAEAGLVQAWLMRLSGVLPHNIALMTVTVLCALVPLYFAVEQMFGAMEFPDRLPMRRINAPRS